MMPILPALSYILTGISGAIGAFFTWLISRAGQRFLMVTAFVAVVILSLATLNSTITSLLTAISTAIPDLGYFYNLFVPDNFPSFVSTILAIEVALAVYKWAYKLGSAKAGVS